MENLKINMTFECLTWRQPIISHIITKCIETTLSAEKITVPCEINVMVTDDKGIHAVNLASRQIDRPTDVLSFPMYDFYEGEEPEVMDGEPIMLGDVVISLKRCKEQAIEIGNSFLHELAFLTAHSILHLLGYDHERSEDDERAQCDAQKKIIETMLKNHLIED